MAEAGLSVIEGVGHEKDIDLQAHSDDSHLCRTALAAFLIYYAIRVTKFGISEKLKFFEDLESCVV